MKVTWKCWWCGKKYETENYPEPFVECKNCVSWSKHEREEALDKAAIVLMTVCVGVIIGAAVISL